MSVTTEVVPSLAPTCAEMDSNVCRGPRRLSPLTLVRWRPAYTLIRILRIRRELAQKEFLGNRADQALASIDEERTCKCSWAAIRRGIVGLRDGS